MLNIPEFLSSSSHPGRAEDAARMLEEAQASSPQSPEPAQVKASLLVEVGGREEEARAALRHSMSLWYVRPASLCGGDQDEHGGGMEEAWGTPQPPPENLERAPPSQTLPRHGFMGPPVGRESIN